MGLRVGLVLTSAPHSLPTAHAPESSSRIFSWVPLSLMRQMLHKETFTSLSFESSPLLQPVRQQTAPGITALLAASAYIPLVPRRGINSQQSFVHSSSQNLRWLLQPGFNPRSGLISNPEHTYVTSSSLVMMIFSEQDANSFHSWPKKFLFCV